MPGRVIGSPGGRKYLAVNVERGAAMANGIARIEIKERLFAGV